MTTLLLASGALLLVVVLVQRLKLHKVEKARKNHKRLPR